MPVKMTRHYFDLAQAQSEARYRTSSRPARTKRINLAGSEDPGLSDGLQLRVEGLLHKYEMGLMYVVSTCSAHCRFCYREELIARKEITRQDGTVAKKGLAQIPEVVELHQRAQQARRLENGGVHPETGREKLREILLSGGDPMVLKNAKIAAWLAALAEAGIESIRLGTKEMAFYPKRFDERIPRHAGPLPRDVSGRRLPVDGPLQPPGRVPAQKGRGRSTTSRTPNGTSQQWNPVTRRPLDARRGLAGLAARVENQAPIIKGINDNPDALRTMQRELYRAGVGNHYFFCGRDIVAYKAFNVPIEDAWQHASTNRRKGCPASRTHARLSITHYKGKTEVAAVTNEPIPGLAGGENGVLIFKILRNALDAPDRGKVCIVGRNPEARLVRRLRRPRALRRGRSLRLRPRDNKKVKAKRRVERPRTESTDDRQDASRTAEAPSRTSSTARPC